MLVLTTALSFTASFGLSSLLWHGLGYPGVQAVIPIYIFIFLAARIREEPCQLGLRGGTVRRLGVTGGVITATGIVLAGTFAALTQIPEVDITEAGAAVGLGALLDTLIVRTVLVPASLLTIGERVWWPNRGAKRHLARDPLSAARRSAVMPSIADRRLEWPLSWQSVTVAGWRRVEHVADRPGAGHRRGGQQWRG